MPGTFVVKRGPTGKFRFSLVASNGRVIVSSEAYETKRAAMSGIASVRKLAAEAGMEDTSVAAKADGRAAAKQPAKSAAAGKPAARKPAAKKAASARPAARKR